jgi:hypothetical protein
MKHEDSGGRCLENHSPSESGYPSGGQCIQCKNCREMLRPEDMAEECPAAPRFPLIRAEDWRQSKELVESRTQPRWRRVMR